MGCNKAAQLRLAQLTILILGLIGSANGAEQPGLIAVPFQDVHIKDAFWGPRIKANQQATIEANLHQCEITGRIKNFAIAGKLESGQHQGFLYNDSDLYKVIEGIGYTLAGKRDPDLEKRTDAMIDKIAAAQQPDGYLNTYFTLVKPEEKWKNLQFSHELYCAGHLIEAAAAYYQATGKRKLLDVAIRFADHIGTVFGPGQRAAASGHEEIELALIKLYRLTKEKRYLELAQFFLDMRGRADRRRLFGEYAQDHIPVRQQREVAGHAVRAMYLYSAMADVAAATGDKGLLAALDSIWHDVVDRKMYITGGIGPSAHNEGFTVPYDLPNDSAYAETCAAIGMALWNHRMFLMTGDGKYADVLEREVYNGLLSGVSLGGDRFFYVNPLGSKGNHHRVPWFDCSCCPTNIVRYIPGIGERAYAYRANSIWTVLYMGSEAVIPLKDGKVRLTQQTNYPWDGRIEILIEPEKPLAFDLKLRQPGWCQTRKMEVKVNQGLLGFEPVDGNGFVTLSQTWHKGDVVVIQLPTLEVKRVHADPHVKADVGRVALQRGPVVYCLEGIDNDGQVRNLALPPGNTLEATFEKSLLGGVAVVLGNALSVSRDDEGKLHEQPVRFKAVPYSTWDNRHPGQMVVWLPESPELAEVQGEDGLVAHGIHIRTSHVNPSDTLAALNDGVLPKGSNDHSIPRMTWWDHRGTTEWVSYRYARARKVSSAAVYWFDDTGRGACRVPATWRLLWLDGKAWKPVKLAEGSSYGTALDKFNKVAFEPVTTRELKLEVKLKTDLSGGILEWQTTDSP
jgi:DUF1680 family protein